MSRLPRPPELAQVEADLAEARARREELRRQLGTLATLNGKDSDVQREREMRDIAAAMDTTEAEIVHLRRRRAELRAPLAAVVATEMAPVVDRAATQILAGLATVQQGLGQLREAALVTRPLSAGGLNETALAYSVESLATLDLRHLRALEAFAKRLKGEIV